MKTNENKQLDRSRSWTRIAKAARALSWGGLFVAALSADSSAQASREYRGFRRLMPGGNRQEIEDAQALGFQAFLTQQLNHLSLPDAEGDGLPGGNEGVREYFPVVRYQPFTIVEQFQGTVMNDPLQEIPRQQMRNARIWRWVFSQQGLYETMTWEWDRHFNIDQFKRGGWTLFPYWNRTVTREHALGSFRDLLRASAGLDSARAAGMLSYLDNLGNTCNGTSVNENYAREIMELHALGTAQDLTRPQLYTESDVRALARILTGWELTPPMVPTTPMNRPYNTQNFAMTRSSVSDHCGSAEMFLGSMIAAGPPQVQANEAIDRMVSGPAAGGGTCQEFIARKLVKVLLTDVPREQLSVAQQAVVDRAVVAAFLAFGPDGNIDAMIAAIMTDANLDDLFMSPGAEKYMEPTKFVSTLLSAADAVFPTQGLNPPNMEGIVELLNGFGESPYAFPPPDGYPTEIDAWVQNQPARWNFAEQLFRPNPTGPNGPNCVIPGVGVDVAALYAPLGGFDLSTAGQQVSRILTGGNMSALDVTILTQYAIRIALQGNVDVPSSVLAMGAMAPSYSLY